MGRDKGLLEHETESNVQGRRRVARRRKGRITFHRCVVTSRLWEENVLQFYPPDGSFEILKVPPPSLNIPYLKRRFGESFINSSYLPCEKHLRFSEKDFKLQMEPLEYGNFFFFFFTGSTVAN